MKPLFQISGNLDFSRKKSQNCKLYTGKWA